MKKLGILFISALIGIFYCISYSDTEVATTVHPQLIEDT